MDNKMTEYILKHSRKKDKELKYDFMPSLLEIIERPAHKAGTVIIMGIFTLLIAAVVWACLSEVDVVITAGGTVQPIGNLNVVQSYSNGVVKAINVSEGAYVKKGDVLIELDTESLEIDQNQLDSQKKILEAQKKVYEKIKDGEDISKVKADDYDEELRPYVQAILDSDSSYHNTLKSLEKDKENADLNYQIAQIQLEEYEINGISRQAEIQELVVKQNELALNQAETALKDTKTQYSAQINAKISEISSKLDEVETSLEKYTLTKRYQSINAPVDGYINSISVNTTGAAITAAQELITIVPDNAPVEVVCYVKNMDIADIEVGMEAEIKLEAYPYNKFGTVKSKVKYISPSSFVSEQLGSVYLVKLEITETPDGINIFSGLSGSIEIKTDKRTVMEYFLEPIMKGFGESLKEK